jgi:hypothetical protein
MYLVPLVVTAASLAGAATMPVAAPAARAAAGGRVLHACYDRHTGALRVATNGGCGAGQVSLRWSVQGAAGARGAAGPAGAEGPKAPEGVTGASGPTGRAGAAGIAGAAGATGPTGAAGAAGAQGVTGATGPTGPSGAAGAGGATGGAGPTGPTGSTGSGTTGPSGPAGASGAAGAAGSTGPAGLSRAETLASGHSESGAWSVTGTAEPLPGHEGGAAISFVLPLAAPITEASHVVYLKASESEPTTGPCKGGTPSAPKAEAGFLCVFTGKEENENAPFKQIQNAAGEAAKVSRTGAFVIFEATSTPAKIAAYGSWTVTAP